MKITFVTKEELEEQSIETLTNAIIRSSNKKGKLKDWNKQ